MAEVQSPGTLTVSSKIKTVSAICMFVGLAAFVILLINDKSRAWHAYLIGFFYFTSLALGGLFFSAVQHMVKAGWSVNVRRLSESLTSFLPFAFGAAIVMFIFGASDLYSWMDPELAKTDRLIHHKSSYLNGTFFGVRIVVFFILWLLFSKVIVGRSLKQDETGDVNITHKLVGWSVAFMLVFALSYSLFSVDTMMSLEPHWFSTIFGIYAFAGLFQSTMAVMILMCVYLIKKGKLKNFVNENHLHDLGKFMCAFVVFWAYIAFSQYMLIWYANLPEETLFYVPRTQGGWALVSVALILFKFIVPFLALLSRRAKRNMSMLSAVAILVLVMQFVDMFWIVYPVFDEEHVRLGLGEVGVFLGFAGVFIYTVTRFLSQHALVPYKDPRIAESMHHHVTY